MVNFYDLTWENSHRVLSRFDFACFIGSKDSFPTNKIRGLDYLQKYNFLGQNLEATEDIIYRKTESLNKFKDKKVLVIGAGPTTNWYDLKADESDFIFSCNHFFLNDKINKAKVDLAIINDEVDLNGEKFLKHIVDNNTILVLDDYNSDINNIVDLNNKIDNDIIQCVLRYQPKTGVAPKLVVLATLLGCKEVHYVGVDGPPKDKVKGEADDTHAFEKNKPWGTHYPYELFVNHYECLKLYLENDIGKDVVYKNLGSGHEHNIMSKI